MSRIRLAGKLYCTVLRLEYFIIDLRSGNNSINLDNTSIIIENIINSKNNSSLMHTDT